MPLITGEYVGVKEALQKILVNISAPFVVEKVPTERAYGRTVAAEVSAREDRPPTDTSHMDGYSVRAADLKSASHTNPVRLRIVASLRPAAGHAFKIRRGEAVRVATGSQLPRGADAVVPLEQTRRSHGAVLIDSVQSAGSFVLRKGEVLRKGDNLVRRGQTIRAQDVALLLDVGVNAVQAYAKPRVAILATGDELSDSTRPPKGTVRNTLAPLFRIMLEAEGCIPVDMGIARDVEGEVKRKVNASLKAADFLLTTGGTSAGAKDFTVKAVQSLEPEVFFHGVRMDRGRVTGVAVVSGKPTLMMPGPVQAAMNAFAVLGVPVIDRLSGRQGGPAKLFATLTKGWEGRKGFEGFTKIVYLRSEDGGRAEPIIGETESIRVLTKADGYTVVPEGVTSLRRGAKVEVNLLPGFSYAS